MKSEEQVKNKRFPWAAVFFLGMAEGALLFILIYGIGALNPTNDGWILNFGGDFAQHYICWEFFRKALWQFPIGLFDGLVEGESISCMFTDSIPLFAIFFKFLSPILPETFQYIGLWGLFTFSMQGGVSSLILYRLTKRPVFSPIGCSLFILCPPVLHRLYGHESLAGQWIILLAFLSWICQGRKWKFKATPVIIWSLNGIIAVLVHIYFIPMIYLVMLGYIATDIFGRKNFIRPIACFVSTTASTLMAMYVLGAFGGSVSYNSDGLGKYSANYNTLLNSQGYSKYINQLNSFPGQYEGFAYLGLGIIIGAVIALVLVLIKTENKNLFKSFVSLSKIRKIEIISVIVIFVISMVIAASPKGTINGRVLYDIKLPSRIFELMSIFRATGRFVWVAEYIVYLSVLLVISKYSGKRTALVCLLLITIVQVLDLRVTLRNENLRDRVINEYNDPLMDPKWDEISKDADEILFAPLPEDYFIYQDMFYIFGEYADEYNLELSCFTVSRNDTYENTRDKAEKKLQKILDGTSDRKYIVVFIHADDIPEANDNITLYELDGYNIAVNY